MRDYLFKLTNSKLKMMSHVSNKNFLPERVVTEKDHCLMVPATQGWMIINKDYKSLSTKSETHGKLVLFLDGAINKGLIKLSDFYREGSVTQSEYYLIVGEMFGYPKLNCEIFAKEMMTEKRTDRVALHSKVSIDVSIIGYHNVPESISGVTELFKAWDGEFYK